MIFYVVIVTENIILIRRLGLGLVGVRMLYIEAFSKVHMNRLCFPTSKSVFLAGGISNCINWQAEAVKLLEYIDFIVVNPRRADFDITDSKCSTEQIEWEHKHLQLCESILFWFPKETLCPITLFEYGKYLVSDKKLVVGCHPEYARALDLDVQTRLERPELKVHRNLSRVIAELIDRCS